MVRDLVLVGLGQAHRRLLSYHHELARSFRVTVVAPHDGRFGGATAAMLSGALSVEQLRWSPPATVRVITSRAVGCQPLHRRLWLADGRVLDYARLSLNSGTRRWPAWASSPRQGEPRTWSGHSTTQLIGLRAVLEAATGSTIVIVGGSSRALEIAGGLVTSNNRGRIGRVTLLWPKGSDDRRTQRALRRLAWLGVDVVSGETVGLGEGSLRCVDGRRFAADHVVCAGPAEPDPLALAMCLPTRGAGLQIDRWLTSPRASTVHILGAAASLDGRQPLPGWDGERQAQVVLSALRAAPGLRSVKRYKPPSRDIPLDLGPSAGVVSSTVWLSWWARWRRRKIQYRGLAAAHDRESGVRRVHK